MASLFATCVIAGSCVSIGEGSGSVVSDHLYAKDCWDGAFDLDPDFFVADPFRNTVQFRMQHGSDLLEVSDGLVVLVDDIEAVRGMLGQDIPVTLPLGVAPPGIPEGTLCGEDVCSSPVHVALYLLDSCHAQNVVLYGTGGTVRFDEIFSGDPNEKDAAEKLTVGQFDVTVGDPRDIVLEGRRLGDLPNTSQVTGRFRFFFQRGQPAQPFP
ncbi:MAG: hypothetical protein JNK04_16280 [Myxococcales bacterium]|nr:hypothetical protein [Myxococcales bacterium]